MRMRRVVALILSFAMLHLSVARVHAVCAPSGVDAAHAPAGDAEPSSHAQHGSQHEGAPDHEETGPVDPACCTGMTVCVTAFDIDANERPLVVVAHDALKAGEPAGGAPLRTTAPEPPPPRA